MAVNSYLESLHIQLIPLRACVKKIGHHWSVEYFNGIKSHTEYNPEKSQSTVQVDSLYVCQHRFPALPRPSYIKQSISPTM